MIYKYMVASVPVPYDLLLPISANPATHPPFVSGGGDGGGGSISSQLRYSTKQDPEAGRCKRTDRKKWRCSRDVAPHQKYCERHMQRDRPVQESMWKSKVKIMTRVKIKVKIKPTRKAVFRTLIQLPFNRINLSPLKFMDLQYYQMRHLY